MLLCLRNGFELSQLDGEGMRAMERQQQMASGEQYKQHLIQQMAVDSGLSISSYRSIYSDESRKEKVMRMLNRKDVGVGDDPQFYDTVDDPIFAKQYDEKVEHDKNIKEAERLTQEMQGEEKLAHIKSRVKADLDQQYAELDKKFGLEHDKLRANMVHLLHQQGHAINEKTRK